MTGAVWTWLPAAGWESEAGASVNLPVLFSLRRKEHRSPFGKGRKALKSGFFYPRKRKITKKILFSQSPIDFLSLSC